MDCKGTLKDVTKDWMTGRFRLTFEVDKDVSGEIERLSGKLLAITAKVYRRKRSLDANSYYWSLLTKLAAVSYTHLDVYQRQHYIYLPKNEYKKYTH